MSRSYPDMNRAHSIPLLDHGYVTLRNMAGPTRRPFNYGPSRDHDGEMEEGFRAFDADDTDVANAARMSFDQADSDRTYATEMKLNRYLMAHRHMTPFESIEVWLEMKLPIFVARQMVRQRTQSINEVSGRYVTLPAEWYIPSTVGKAPTDKKQGQDAGLDPQIEDWFKVTLEHQCATAYDNYLHAIKIGVAPEHARLLLGLNHYTHWMTKMNLRNLMVSFLSLRDHGHAQIEAQLYARATISLIEPHLPGLMRLYEELVKQKE